MNQAEGAYLRGAYLGDVFWKKYVDEVVPALLVSGGKTLAEVATPETWACHSWDNCPMAVAFGAHKIEEIPAGWREEARCFIQFFDAGLIPCPGVRLAGNGVPE